MYTYKAKDIKVIDGDTVECIVDLGFCVFVKERFRFYGVDAPETRTKNLEEKLKGNLSKDFVVSFFKRQNEFKVTVLGKDKYGRWLARFFDDNGSDISTLLLENNLAKEYHIGKK